MVYKVRAWDNQPKNEDIAAVRQRVRSMRTEFAKTNEKEKKERENKGGAKYFYSN